MKMKRIAHCQISAMVVCRASAGVQSSSGLLIVSTHTPRWPITKRQTAFLRRFYKSSGPKVEPWLSFIVICLFVFSTRNIHLDDIIHKSKNFTTSTEYMYYVRPTCFVSVFLCVHIRLIRDEESRTATSTFTQLLSSDPTCERDRSLHVPFKRLTNPTSTGLFQSCCRWALVNMQITTLSTDSYGIQKYVHPSLIIWMRTRTSLLPARTSSQD